jgi:hypothetical protein
MPSFEYYKWIINREERFNIGSFRKNMVALEIASQKPIFLMNSLV